MTPDSPTSRRDCFLLWQKWSREADRLELLSVLPATNEQRAMTAAARDYALDEANKAYERLLEVTERDNDEEMSHPATFTPIPQGILASWESGE